MPAVPVNGAGASKNPASSPTNPNSMASGYLKSHMAQGIGRMTEYVMQSGKGCRVTLDDGRELLDLTCAIPLSMLDHRLISRTKMRHRRHEPGCARFGRPLRIAADRVCEGHCHPVVSKAAADQCMKLVHGQVRSFRSPDGDQADPRAQSNIAFHEPMARLVESLQPIMPDKSLDTFFFWNSGSEAVEAAVKLARHATGRQNIIAMQGEPPRVKTGAS